MGLELNVLLLLIVRSSVIKPLGQNDTHASFHLARQSSHLSKSTSVGMTPDPRLDKKFFLPEPVSAVRISEIYGGPFIPYYQRVMLTESLMQTLKRESGDMRIMGSAQNVVFLWE